MATTAVGATSSVTRTVSATVAGVSPGPPKSNEWHTSRPAAFAAAVDARRSPIVNDLPNPASSSSAAVSMPKSTEVQPAAAQQPEHVRVAHARLQVTGEADVRERGARSGCGAGSSSSQTAAHVPLFRVERRVDDELLGGAEVAAQPLHLVGDGLRRAPPQPRALEPGVGAVHAAVRAAARRLHAGGAVPPGAGEDGGEVAGQATSPRSASSRSTMPPGSSSCAEPKRRRLAVARPRRPRPAARGGSRAGRWRTPGRRGRCCAPAAAARTVSATRAYHSV